MAVVEDVSNTGVRSIDYMACGSLGMSILWITYLRVDPCEWEELGWPGFRVVLDQYWADWLSSVGLPVSCREFITDAKDQRNYSFRT